MATFDPDNITYGGDDELFNLMDLEDLTRDNVSLLFSTTSFFHHMTADRITVASIYMSLFVIGTFGNLAVIFVITTLFCHTKNQASCTGLIRVFVVTLSSVDILILLQLLLVVADICSTQWLFSLGLCRLFWATEFLQDNQQFPIVWSQRQQLLSCMSFSFIPQSCYTEICHRFRHVCWSDSDTTNSSDNSICQYKLLGTIGYNWKYF